MNIWRVDEDGTIWRRWGNAWFESHMSVSNVKAFNEAAAAGAVDYEYPNEVSLAQCQDGADMAR